MDSPRPILPAELEFFNKGTGSGKIHISDWLPLTIVTSFPVPLVVVFTKFDGQIIIASKFVNLTDAKDCDEDKWERAREIAEITFQKDYLPKFLDVKYPPKAYVRLEGENGKYLFLKNGSTQEIVS